MTEETKKKYVAFMRSYYDAMQELPQKARAELALAIIEYGFSGNEISISGAAKAVFIAIKPTIDIGNTRSAAVSARWNKQKQNLYDTKPIQNQNLYDTSLSYIREGKGKGKGDGEREGNNSNKRVPRFTQPTLEEVQAYCMERGNSVDPQRFIDYYSSNGWKVGKNPMKDWKAAVRTWERNNGTTATKPKPTGSYLEILERMERGEAVDAEGNKPNTYLPGNTVPGFDTEPD